MSFPRLRFDGRILPTALFTQEDPIGIAGGLNLYGYANGDPINFSDPFGLCPPKDTNLDNCDTSTDAGVTLTGAYRALRIYGGADILEAMVDNSIPVYLVGQGAMASECGESKTMGCSTAAGEIVVVGNQTSAELAGLLAHEVTHASSAPRSTAAARAVSEVTAQNNSLNFMGRLPVSMGRYAQPFLERAADPKTWSRNLFNRTFEYWQGRLGG